MIISNKKLNYFAHSLLLTSLVIPWLCSACSDGDIAARVGPGKISNAEVRLKLKQLHQEDNQANRTAIVEKLADVERLALLAREAKLDKDDEVRAELDLLHRERLARAYRRRVIGESFDDEQIQEEFEKYSEQQAGLEYHIGFIIGRFKENDEESELEARAKINKAFADLKDGADFGQIARDSSNDPSAKRGGEAGWLDSSSLTPEIKMAVEALEPGDFSGPLRSRFGWMVVKLLEAPRKIQYKPEAVKPLMKRKLQAEKAKAALQTARERWPLEIKK
jgi:peptidyl-prolyl cis-trans isomerase C